jgi:ABC-2 type transport system permease protein
MGNVWTIAKREYKHYFNSPIAYVVAFAMLIGIGAYFAIYIVYAANSMGQVTPTLEPFLWFLGFLLFFAIPPLTMGSIAGEAQAGTMELLLTAPVRDWELVVGKWLGGFLFIISVIAVTWIFPIILNAIVDPGIDQGMLVTGYLGLVLLAAAILGLGVMISSIFSNWVASLLITWLLMFFAWFLFGIFAQVIPAPANTLFSYLDLRAHFEKNFLTGVIDLTDMVFYVTMTALTVFLGSVLVEVRRWR